MKAERMDFWEFLYVDKGNILVRAADDFAESGAVFADAAQGAGRKADDSKRFELTEETAHLKSSRLIQVVHYMQEHVQEQIDMNTLCDVFYMSRSTLQHLFHKEFGCGPMEYFSRMKIRRAREMMREENCNITEIAARLSYGSVQYFSRQFKKEMGMSPMEYLSSVKGITQALR